MRDRPLRVWAASCSWNSVNVLFQSLPNDPKHPNKTSFLSVSLFHILGISSSKSLYLESFSTTLTDVSLSDLTAIFIIWHFLVVWSLMMISGLIAAISLSVWIDIFHRIVVSSFLQQFLVCLRTICQRSWFYRSGRPSNVYVMLRYRAFECIQSWQVLDSQTTCDLQIHQTLQTFSILRWCHLWLCCYGIIIIIIIIIINGIICLL